MSVLKTLVWTSERCRVGHVRERRDLVCEWVGEEHVSVEQRLRSDVEEVWA